MQLFYAPDIIPPHYTLSEEEGRHAVKVLRLGAGSRLWLVDGRGGMYEAEVVNPSPRGCEVRVVSSVSGFGSRGYSLTMAVAPTKNSDRFEWFLEKATEVGIDAVVPIECANSERRVFRPERAGKVLVSAMKQSLKACLPRLEPFTPLNEILERPFAGVKLIAHCRSEEELAAAADADGADCASSTAATDADGAGSATKVSTHRVPITHVPITRVPITEALPRATDALVLIGPEGDFSVEEVELALRHGFVPVSIGDSRLRTETAALAVVMAAYLANL